MLHQCKKEIELYQQTYPDGVFVTDDPCVGSFLPVDNYSLSIYPKDAFGLDCTPVQCFGDGNCLFRLGEGLL